jgi:predicted RNA binding protein YcfA (HicA-like mRNA interferase family)
MPKRYSSSELIDIVQRDGWFLVNITGSHHKYHHAQKQGSVVIPHPKKDIPQKRSFRRDRTEYIKTGWFIAGGFYENLYRVI